MFLRFTVFSYHSLKPFFLRMAIVVFIIGYIRGMLKIALIMGGWVYRGDDFIQGGG